MISSPALRRVLILAPHADDEVLGCGGLLNGLRDTTSEVRVVIQAVGDTFFWHLGKEVPGTQRMDETRDACAFLGVDPDNVSFMDNFNESYMDTVSQHSIVTKIDSIINEFHPTAVFIPYPSFHQDHQVLFKAAFAALRPSPSKSSIELVAMYEYPNIVWNYDDLKGGDWYLPLSESDVEAKVEAMRWHKSQIREGAHMISPESIRAWAKYRGLEVGLDYAEKYRILRAIG